MIDRFEGDFAVLIVGEEKTRLNFARALLPKTCEEGTWLQVEIQNGLVTSAEIDEEETVKAKQRIADKLERLRRGEHRKNG